MQPLDAQEMELVDKRCRSMSVPSFLKIYTCYRGEWHIRKTIGSVK